MKAGIAGILAFLVVLALGGLYAAQKPASPRIPPAMVRVLNPAENTFGSGFVINSQGCILTDGHVTEYQKEFRVESEKDSFLGYSLSVADPVTDLAVICPRSLKEAYLPTPLVLIDEEPPVDSLGTVIGYSDVTGAFEKADIKFLGHLSITLFPIKIEEGLKWREIDTHFAKGGFSGGPILYQGKVVGVTNVIVPSSDRPDLNYFVSVKSTVIIPWLHQNGILHKDVPHGPTS